MNPSDRLAELLAEIAIDDTIGDRPAIHKAVQLARHLQARGTSLQTPEEKRQQAELERMVQSPHDKATLMQMTDQAFRAKTPSRAADQLTHILDVQGIPRFFSTMERAMLKGFQSFGSFLPGVSMPLVKERMRSETANVILPAEDDMLADYLTERRKSGVRMNVNYLGEALLGEDDARARLKHYIGALQRPEIEVLSVKATTLYSQITPISRTHAQKILCDRLELLYRAAAKTKFEQPDGSLLDKLVYLDMEEYRDLLITVDAFMDTLDREGLEQVNAGIALQAYIPDSFLAQQRINEWARERVARGGAPVTIRLVKGANMEAERVEASLHGWPQAPFSDKLDTDANYKRMLHAALEPETIEAVRLGVASHNLFDVAYALVLAHDRGVLAHVQFEMLEGMANHQRRALCEIADSMLLYAPATRRENFVNAIGYLVRRLDENTGPENFLRHAFKIEVGGEEWQHLEQQFLASFTRIDALSSAPRRNQDRGVNHVELRPIAPAQDFEGEPDTDFSLEQNLRWAERIIARWEPLHGEQAARIPLVIAGEEIHEGRNGQDCHDPSRPGVVVGRYCQASTEDIDRALACAADDPSGWRTMDPDARESIMARVAQQLRMRRGELIGAALADAGKLVSETDPEVSEAIDFVEYYAASARAWRATENLQSKPKGVVVVVPPWNFPVAIPCGGISAGLAAGNTVILKPASHTVLVAYELCKCFWNAGVPKDALQFVPCSGRTGGAQLVASEIADVVILTGGTDTALRMLAARPTMNLLAETGGKNATIVSSMSDRELAIKNVIQAAFGHTGQKCSATSLLILEREVYESESFRTTLCDAVKSMKVSSAWKLDTKIGPLTHQPSGDLVKGLKELELGESWALMPRNLESNPCLYSPAIKWDVARGSYTHMTEFFGPVLAVIPADNLQEAIAIVNETGYGLTSALESLDRREQAIWREQIRSGNLYINRGTTGAIVLRQPFGGMGKSAFGPGIKAGGPNYVAQLMDFEDAPNLSEEPGRQLTSPQLQTLGQAISTRITNGEEGGLPLAQAKRVLDAIDRYDAACQDEFAREHDHFLLVGQDNIRRYLPVGSLRLRIHEQDTPFEIFARACAARAAGCRMTVSYPTGLKSATIELLDELTASWAAIIEFVEESDEDLVSLIEQEQCDRIRYAAPGRAPESVLRAVGDSGIYIAQSPVLASGRIELLWYLREQSISHDYHRYGNAGDRTGETRRPVL